MSRPSDPTNAGLIELDERGTRCPLPVIALAKAATAHPGAILRLRSDDPASRHDVPAWCRMKGATLVEMSEPEPDATTTFIVQAPDRQG